MDIRTLMVCTLLAVSASGGAAAAPPAAPEASGETIVLHSDRAELADARLEAFNSVSETCPNYASSPTLVVPVTRGDSLFGYAFVTPRLCLARGVSEFTVTREMHFIVDLMIRAAHRTPMTMNAEDQLGRAETTAAMLAAARTVIGDGRIERLDLLGSDIRALR